MWDANISSMKFYIQTEQKIKMLKVTEKKTLIYLKYFSKYEMSSISVPIMEYFIFTQ